jgi:hypothetical protein
MKNIRTFAGVLSAAVIAATAHAAQFTFTVSMTGPQETGGGDVDGTASGTVTIDNVTNVVSWNLTYANIATPGLMHIHTGAAGVAGGILVNMGVATTGGPGTLINQTTVPASSVTTILANPPGFYVNIHNSPFPAGAVRGQLTPPPPPCDGDMNGDNLVDGADLGALLGFWGTNNADADINNDGLVDGADLGALLGNWGPC